MKPIQLIASLASLKLLIHALTNTNYHFHRDEYLYLVEGQHLGWGYMEIPPFTAFLASIANFLGGSVFMVRLFPALAGVITVILIGKLISDLGGKNWAIAIGCLGFIFSRAYLRSNTLFQPVSFDQFFWFLTAFFLIKLVLSEKKEYWYYAGMAIGLGFLTKYSIVFYALGLSLALLISQHRKWFLTRHPYIALGIALLIAAPNIYWQYAHNYPVLDHMEELRQNQLVNVRIGDYLWGQIDRHLAASLIWLAGLYYLLFHKTGKAFRFVGIGYFLMLIIIALLGGKTYYTMGAYASLFVFGGIFLEKWLRKTWMKITLLAAIFIFNSLFLPYALPILPLPQMKKYCAFMKDNFGMTSPLLWEDGKIYDIPQDYADMDGWIEIVEKVSTLYHSLPEAQQKTCMIYGGGYAHAGVVNFYRKKYKLPKAYSFNSSFIIWNKENIVFDNQIMIDDTRQTGSSWFENMLLVDSIENPLARDPGWIYYRSKPKIDVQKAWAEEVRSTKEKYNFK